MSVQTHTTVTNRMNQDSIGDFEYQKVDHDDSMLNSEPRLFIADTHPGEKLAEKLRRDEQQSCDLSTGEQNEKSRLTEDDEDVEVQGFMHEGVIDCEDQMLDDSEQLPHQYRNDSSVKRIDEYNAFHRLGPKYSPSMRPYGNNTDLESITQSNRQLEDHAQQFVESNQTQDFYQVQQIQDIANLRIHTSSASEDDETWRNNEIDTKNELLQDAQNNFMSQQQPPQVFQYTEVFVWGEEKFGQLGIDSQLRLFSDPSVRRPDFIQVPRSCSFNIVINQVSCGQSHSAIVTSMGHLYMMGSNKCGQLGVMSTGPKNYNSANLSPKTVENEALIAGSPCLVETLKSFKVLQVSCGNDFTVALVRPINQNQEFKQKAEVYSWGSNHFGQLGLENIPQINLPTRIEAFDVLDEEITQISSGSSHTLFLSQERDVISCGNNFDGQCGFDPDECNQTSVPFKVAAFEGADICQVSAGYRHSLYLSADGLVYTSGSNQDFQLGVGHGIERTNSPMQVEALQEIKIKQVNANYNSGCISTSGELFLWGKGTFGELAFPQKVVTISSRVKDLSLGLSVGVAVDEQGLAWAWGSNNNGELGVGDREPRVHPFPLLNLKGKYISKVQCGDSYVICLGNQVQKEIPNLNFSQKTNTATPKIPEKSIERRKRIGKRKKSIDNKVKSRSIQQNVQIAPRSNTVLSTQHQKVNHDSMVVAANSRKSRYEMMTKSYNNNASRPSSQERSVSASRTNQHKSVSRSQHRQPTSQERAFAVLQTKYTPKGVHNPIKPYEGQMIGNSQVCSNPNPLKSPKTLQFTIHSQKQNTLATLEQQRVQQENAELKLALKQAKCQLKYAKDDNKSLKTEIAGKNLIIDKLERQIKNEPLQHQSTIESLQHELRRADLKMKKMKEHRKVYKQSKEIMQRQLDDYRKDNETLVAQIAQMQETAHQKRQENAQLRSQLTKTQNELGTLQEEMINVQEQMAEVRDNSKKVEHELMQIAKRAEDRVQELKQQNIFDSNQQRQMNVQVKELEKQIDSREEYICNLEKEAIMLRQEIKNAKYSNDRHLYQNFVSKLTTLRPEREKLSTSRDRPVLKSLDSAKENSSLSIERNQRSESRGYYHERERIIAKERLSVVKDSPRRDQPQKPQPDNDGYQKQKNQGQEQQILNQPAFILTAQITSFSDKEENQRLTDDGRVNQNNFKSHDASQGTFNIEFTNRMQSSCFDAGENDNDICSQNDISKISCKQNESNVQTKQSQTLLGSRHSSQIIAETEDQNISNLLRQKDQNLDNSSAKRSEARQNSEKNHFQLAAYSVPSTQMVTTPMTPHETENVQHHSNPVRHSQRNTGQVPSGALSLGDNYKAHLLKKFDQRIMNHRQNKLDSSINQEK